MMLSIFRAYPAAGGTAWIYWRPDTCRWVRGREIQLPFEDVSETARALGLGPSGTDQTRGPALYALDVSPTGRRARARLAAGVED
jgi:hypothetical protein